MLPPLELMLLVTVSEPVISAFPVCEPSHSAVTPVIPLPSPTKEPLNVEPLIAVALVKSTYELDTISEPVRCKLPVMELGSCWGPIAPVEPTAPCGPSVCTSTTFVVV